VKVLVVQHIISISHYGSNSELFLGGIVRRLHAPGAWKIGVWMAGAAFFGWAGFGAAYWTVSAIVTLFTVGAGTRAPGELSAYSVSTLSIRALHLLACNALI